ncbi:hypothetical protein J7E69_12220 [Rhodococcus enclensis]|nr:hypothetical protein [Rhodococcus qingshengii]
MAQPGRASSTSPRLQCRQSPEAEQQLRDLGAELASHQPGGQRFRAFHDPAGHPFCVTSSQVAATIPPDMAPDE